MRVLFVFVGLLMLVASLVGGALANAAQAAEPSVVPESPFPAYLDALSEPSNGPADDEPVPLKLEMTHVDVRIQGALADVMVTQVYRHIGSISCDTVYVVPAFVTRTLRHLSVRTGDEMTWASLPEEVENDAECADPDLEAYLDALLPGQELVVEYNYTEMLRPVGGLSRFIFPAPTKPILVGRFRSRADCGQPREHRRSPAENSTPYSLTLRFDPVVPLKEIEVPGGLPKAVLSSEGLEFAFGTTSSPLVEDFVVLFQPKAGLNEGSVPLAEAVP